ncbi:30S ribosomal protein S4 [Candidatus Synchoanobacter obligatus]|uniref:Small ribosomal subunit protein uS4 n=1 Tax=Candidatus Synchoanobacter obligatus TaxID=2919597 RepID=A0ABT1L5Q9_9GAMM|nr:30S ribosomal protein S4 [Candidatus Synchoanobacter obligatus]MCP8352509.1 30S ribosomal protein S4 [Candidatus Synchoanobacter obligatus]
MGMYHGPRAKKSRAVGMDLNQFGVRPYETKCKNTTKPGQSGKRRPGSSRFGDQQKAVNAMRHYYYVKGKQFENYFSKAKKLSGATDENFIQLLESRLDSVVFTMGFGLTKRQTRQMVSHGLVTVNGKVVNKPGYAIKPGDEVAIKESARKQDQVQMSVQLARENKQYEWVECDYDSVSGVYKSHPTLDQINLFDSNMLGMVIVYYSK